MPTTTTGHFTYANWQEKELSSSASGHRLCHASVTNAFSGGIEAEETSCEYTIAYVTEQTGTFTGMEMLSGQLDGRRGSLVLQQHGTFDTEGTVRCSFEIVEGTGTEELAGVTGSGSFTARRGEGSVPYTLTYKLG